MVCGSTIHMCRPWDLRDLCRLHIHSITSRLPLRESLSKMLASGTGCVPIVCVYQIMVRYKQMQEDVLVVYDRA